AIAALGSICGSSAQPARTRYRIGVVALQPTADMVGSQPRSPTQRAFLDRLRELGYVYGENFVTEVRGSAGDLDRFPTLAAELIHAKVDVIVATGAAVAALKQATSTIPVVMSATNDPVREGLVQSLGHPGGNITGLSLQSIDTIGKRLELLKELVPGDAPVAILWNAPEVWQAAASSAKQK